MVQVWGRSPRQSGRQRLVSRREYENVPTRRSEQRGHLARRRERRKARHHHARGSPEGRQLLRGTSAPAAVDRAAATSVMASAAVPFGTFNNVCVQTLNTSGLDPSDIETNHYAPGIGSVLEVDADGTRQQLVSFNGQTSSVAAAQGSAHHNLVQAMASFGDHQAGLAQGHATDHSENASLHHVLAGPSHQGP